ncbi:MAG: DUF4342 domain-containing protein [Chloroflexota bacterium]
MPKKEKIRVPGNKLVETIKQLVSRGDSRRLCLLSEEKRLLEVPLVVGDPAAPATMLEAPVLAAINAFSALVNECTIEVEKK